MKYFFAIKNKNDEIRLISSSGGVFITLANFVIEKNGIVYGATYDEKFEVKHIRVDNKENLKKFCGSKYTKSFIGNCYKQVKKDLIENKEVLFSGTPCQIYALKKYLNKNYKNLLLVDIICHGTPMVNYFNEYKKYMETKYKSKIIDINMRYKNKKKFYNNYKKSHKFDGAVEPHIMYIKFENGKRYIMPSRFDSFYQLFDYFTSQGCFNCSFSNVDRISDITIGDFHEFSSKLKDFNDGNGVSLAIINTEKGYKYFNEIKDNFYIQKKKIEECLQPALENPMKKPDKYDEFQNDFQKFGFNFVTNKYTNKHIFKKLLYKMGILDFISDIKSNIKSNIKK